MILRDRHLYPAGDIADQVVQKCGNHVESRAEKDEQNTSKGERLKGDARMELEALQVKELTNELLEVVQDTERRGDVPKNNAGDQENQQHAQVKEDGEAEHGPGVNLLNHMTYPPALNHDRT